MAMISKFSPQIFKTYFSFGIFAVSEHCLFEEQLDLLKPSTGHTYNSTAVRAFDNPPSLSGNIPMGVLCYHGNR